MMAAQHIVRSLVSQQPIFFEFSYLDIDSGSILYSYCIDGRTIDTEEGFTGRGHGNGDNLI